MEQNNPYSTGYKPYLFFSSSFLLSSCFLILSSVFLPALYSRDTITLTSPAFENGAMIPAEYTCDGKNISPPLRWGDVPEKTMSIALIVHDPDAPGGDWLHWTVYDLPPTIHSLPEGMPRSKALIFGEKQGMTDFKTLGYGGPCPPSATHRYYFRIYALDKFLYLEGGASRSDLTAAMQGHILAEGELMGRYQKK